VFLFYLR